MLNYTAMLKPHEIRVFRKEIAREDARLPIVFAALGEPRRCLIFRSLLAHKRLCVSDVARAFNISMSLASQHLKILEVTKLVVREKEGRASYFKANTADDIVRAIIKAVR